MSVDRISNFLTAVRNAIARAKYSVDVPYSLKIYNIAQIFLQEGFISSIEVVGDTVATKKISITLKYVDQESSIHELKQVSKPGRRVFVPASRLPKVIGGLGVAVITTSKGVITNKHAAELNVGGEVICTVW